MASPRPARPERGAGPRTEAPIRPDADFRDALATLLRACADVRIPPTDRELGVLGVASGLALSLVVLGLLSMRGAVADVAGIVNGLPPTSGQDDERDRRASRSAAIGEYHRLLVRRCLPGLLLAAVGAGWLSYVLWRALH